LSTTYVDGTTPLNAANMNALQQKVEKAAANGYASLDATGKVPAAQLPAAVTGIPLPVVNGQWIKGVGGAAVWSPIAYADVPGIGSSPSGSITAANTDLAPTTLVTTYTIYPNGGGTVRSIVGPAQGAVVHFWNASPTAVTFKNALSGGAGATLQNKGSVDLTLNPFEGVSYAWDGGGNWREVGEARVAVGYGTSLPASPVDGQEYVLVDSLTNASYCWRFRYNAGSGSANKWEFIGGSPAVARVETTEATTSGTYVDLATVGPSFTIPRAGDYLLRWGYHAANTAQAQNAQAIVARNGAGQGNFDLFVSFLLVTVTGNVFAGAAERTMTGLAAADVLKLLYMSSNGGGLTFSRRFLVVQPVRVS